MASIANAANHTTHITDYSPHGQPTRIVDPNGAWTANMNSNPVRSSSIRTAMIEVRRGAFAVIVMLLCASTNPATGQVPACQWYAANDTVTRYDTAEDACRGFEALYGVSGYPIGTWIFTHAIFWGPGGAYCYFRYGPSPNSEPTLQFAVGRIGSPPLCVVSGQQPGGAIDPTKNVGSGESTCGLFTGHPINVGTGNKVLEENDYATANLRFGRTYNHLIAHGTARLTIRWTHTFSRSIALGVNSNRVFAYRADGRMLNARLVNTQIINGEQPWTFEAFSNERLIRRFNAASQPVGWTLITADDTSEDYDVAGRLTSVRLRSGAQQTLSYSNGTAAGGYVLDAQGNPTSMLLPAGLLTRVADVYDRQLVLGYNVQSRLIKLTDPANGVYRYDYDGAGNLR